MPFQDAELEKFYAYGRLLLNKLPKKGISEKLKLNDEVALEYYRLQKISEGSIILEKGGEYKLKPPTEVGTKKEKEELAALSEIIDVFNERFGKPLTDADKLFFDQIEEELVSVETLSKQAKTNTIGNFNPSWPNYNIAVIRGHVNFYSFKNASPHHVLQQSSIWIDICHINFQRIEENVSGTKKSRS
jgi:hypothetical protein